MIGFLKISREIFAILIRINFKRKKVRSPKGFGKHYFTLAAILAYSAEKTLQSQTAQITSLFTHTLLSQEQESQAHTPPSDFLTSLRTLNAKPCHCNYFYRLRTRIILKINHFIPRCPYYTTWFAFRRTGVHPPHMTR